MLKHLICIIGPAILGFMFLVTALNTTFQDDYKTIQEVDQVVTLTGTVLDAEREVPIPNAKVKVNETQKSTKTGDTGLFTLEELETGTYTLEVQAEGYERNETKIELSEDEDNSVEVKLTANY